MSTLISNEHRPLNAADAEPVARVCFGRDFWGRADVERARKMLDLWASCKRASAAGVDGCPTAEAIFERVTPVLGPRLDHRTGLWITDEELYVPTSTHRALPEPRVAELAVDSFFRELGTPRLAVSLLYFLYPRSGPYEQEGDIGEFRPQALFGRLGGKYLDRSRTALASQLHRESVLRLAGMCSDSSFEIGATDKGVGFSTVGTVSSHAKKTGFTHFEAGVTKK